MRAITVQPMVASSARLEDLPEPATSHASPDTVVARALAIGVCGTDLEIVRGLYGAAPPGSKRLILGHECLAEVVAAPAGAGFAPGDRFVPIVRRPDPVPCGNCAAGEWDMCRNGQYTEHGIMKLHGFACDRFAVAPAFAVAVPAALGVAAVLVEPTSVVAKAWEHIERIGARAQFKPGKVLVTGAGPIGLLAALLGVQRHLEVHVLDRATSGPKPELVRALGATYHTGAVADAAREVDIIIECTGAAQLVVDAMHVSGPNGIVCLTGISSGGRALSVDVGQLGSELVLENTVVFGSVNANRRHYEAAVRALVAADREWLGRVVTRKVSVANWTDALARRPTDVKPVIVFDEAL